MKFELVVVGSRELGIPFAARPDGEIALSDSDALASLIPAIFAVRHNLVPLGFADDVLSVAMAAPTDLETLRRLRLITRCQIQPFVATRAQIRRAIVAFYR